MAEQIPDNALVLVAGKLATVQRAERRAGADGYQITDGGAYSRFASEWQVERPVIGQNVCAGGRVCPPAWCCPLPHPTPDQLGKIRAQS